MAVPISNVTRRQVYAPSGAGGAGPYAFTFEILANTDIAVYKDDVLLTLTTHYTVTINANGTGSVTITATGLALAPTSPTQYAIVGNRTISRTTDFTTGGDFFANTLNDELDQQTIFNQQNAEGLQRALAAPQTDPTSINMTLPRASLRANKALGFDANGNPVISDTLGTNRGNWTAGVLYYVRDIVKDTTNNNIWQVITQHTSSGSQPINTNADSAKWTLLVDAASATASASAAASSASAASTSASNASTSASNASTSASNASTSASNAASSASAASTSASNAAASYDSFDDRYLGPKSSAPSVDNDGNSLLTGALYWDTALNQIRVWSGTAWVNVNASASNTRTAITATAGQTVLTVATYTPGTNTMVVYVNGVKLNASEYTETNATTVTVTTGLALNDEVEVFSYRVNEIGTLGASSVTIADTGNYYAGSNAEVALQEAASFTQAGTGAVTRSKNSKLQEFVSVKDFGAVGNWNGTAGTDDTAAIQAAINAAMTGTGANVYFPPGRYRVTSTLTIPSVTDGKAVICGSGAFIEARHNGVLFDNQNFWVSFRDLTLRGPGKAQANSIAIQGTAYDWYLENVAIYDFQIGYRANGGVHLFQKCFFGGNGKCIWPAVFANIISIDSCYFSTSDYGLYVPNNFGPGPVMYTAQVCIYNTAMEVCDTSVYSVGINRLMVENSWFEQETVGSLVLIDTPLLSINSNYVNFQPSISFTGGFPASEKNNVSIDPYIGVTTSALNITRLNGTAFTTEASFKGTGDGQFSLTNSAGTGNINFNLKGGATVGLTKYRKDSASAVTLLEFENQGNYPNSGKCGISFFGFVGGNGYTTRVLGGNNDIAVDTPNFVPLTDNSTTCGSSTYRWSVVYAATGTINTSDSREKQQIRSLSDAEMAVAVKLKSLIRAFKFNEAVEKKGSGARIHFGVIAQDVKTAFESEGLVAEDYAVLCYDEWPEQPEVKDEEGNVIREAVMAGNRYGVRYEELLAFLISAM